MLGKRHCCAGVVVQAYCGAICSAVRNPGIDLCLSGFGWPVTSPLCDKSRPRELSSVDSAIPGTIMLPKAARAARHTLNRSDFVTLAKRSVVYCRISAPQSCIIKLGDSEISVQHLELAGGDQLPAVGLGFWKIEKSATPEVVTTAIDAGYRHFDCACDYGNEAEVGVGLQRALQAGAVTRDDLWVTSKLWNTYHRTEHVRPALERTLEDLQVDYVDLYLIHFPISMRYVPFDERYPPEWFFDPNADSPRLELDPVPIQETWRAMEQLVADGLAKNIGICNFGTSLLRDLLSYADIRPAVLQIESHPYLTQEKLIRYCNDENIAVTAFSPLGAQSYFSLNMAEQGESVLEHEVVRDIATKHDRTPAQVVLRWGVQRGTAIVPKSSNADRLRENLALFDFELTDDEMKSISALDRNRRFNDPGDFCEAAFNTFMPIYE